MFWSCVVKETRRWNACFFLKPGRRQNGRKCSFSRFFFFFFTRRHPLVNVWMNLRCFIVEFPKPTYKGVFVFLKRLLWLSQINQGPLCLALFFTLDNLLHNPQFGSRQVAQNISTAQRPPSRREPPSEIFITVSPLSQDNDSINTLLWYLWGGFFFVPCSLVRSWLSLSGS